MTATTEQAPGAVAEIATQFATGECAPWDAAQWESVPRDQLVALHQELVAARRRVDAVLAAASAEVARRSTPDDGPAGIARKAGYGSPTRMVAAATGGSSREAQRLIDVGRAALDASGPSAGVDAAGHGTSAGEGDSAGGHAAVREGLSELPSGPRLPAVAAAFNGGEISMDAASTISTMLTRVADRISAETVAEAEQHLVERARALPLNRLSAVVRQVEAQLDAEGARMDEELRRQSRYLHVVEDRDGMVAINGRLDVETAAPVRAALDALVEDSLRRRRDQTNPNVRKTEQLYDDRTVPQMRADALADLARHTLGCEATDLPLPKTTVVVRMALEDLAAGVGAGQIDGADQPVSAGVVRRMAADAEVIPAVLGGESEVLDVGRARRLFTRAQRLALVERDGGCAWCHAPPSYCEAHHIREWEQHRGRTDLDNGVMLCVACHHRVHRDRWEISVRDGTVWFTPPTEVDRSRTPRKGGREYFEAGKAA